MTTKSLLFLHTIYSDEDFSGEDTLSSLRSYFSLVASGVCERICYYYGNKMSCMRFKCFYCDMATDLNGFQGRDLTSGRDKSRDTIRVVKNIAELLDYYQEQVTRLTIVSQHILILLRFLSSSRWKPAHEASFSLKKKKKKTSRGPLQARTLT